MQRDQNIIKTLVEYFTFSSFRNDKKKFVISISNIFDWIQDPHVLFFKIVAAVRQHFEHVNDRTVYHGWLKPPMCEDHSHWTETHILSFYAWVFYLYKNFIFTPKILLTTQFD